MKPRGAKARAALPEPSGALVRSDAFGFTSAPTPIADAFTRFACAWLSILASGADLYARQCRDLCDVFALAGPRR
jgi:hypothetical protein